jgi:hypothetical protein
MTERKDMAVTVTYTLALLILPIGYVRRDKYHCGMNQFDFDAFVSHATEDKKEFVQPLAAELLKSGVKVWFDKFSLKLGDSLRESIEAGLSRSRYGIVVFSPAFLSRNWPKAELNGLFGREMEGGKVILPVWHNISSAEMRAAMPIQADKVAIKSSEGIEAVVNALIAIVRPDLQQLHGKRDFTFEAVNDFINAAQEKSPGYGFSVFSGNAMGRPLPNTILSVTRGIHRIDVSVQDPQSLKERPSAAIAFSAEGAKKFKDFLRTGRAQKWQFGEFTRFEGNLPFMPAHEDVVGSDLYLQSLVDHLPTRMVRLEFGGEVEPVVFPVMTARISRTGTEEAEVVIEGDETPLKLTIAFAVDGSRRIAPSFSWDFVGYSFRQCQKVIDAIDQLRSGGLLKLFDLQSERQQLQTPTLSNQINFDPFSEVVRASVRHCARIQEAFSVELKVSATPPSDADYEVLNILDCLLTNGIYAENLSAERIEFVKADGEIGKVQRLLVAGEPMSLSQEPDNYPGYFTLFGKQIPTPPWVTVTDRCIATGIDIDLAQFDRLQVGEVFALRIKAESPTYIRWNTMLQSSGHQSER